MFNLTIPHPKYPLRRYSTRQLLAWFEECAFIEAALGQEEIEGDVRDQERCKRGDIVRWTRWDIEDVLQERGVMETEIDTMYKLALDDVLS